MSSPCAGGGGEMFRLPGQQCGIALLTAPTNQIIEQRLWPALWSPPPVTGQTSTTLTCQSSQTETVLNYTVTPNKLASEGQVSQGKTSNFLVCLQLQPTGARDWVQCGDVATEARCDQTAVLITRPSQPCHQPHTTTPRHYK